MSEKHPFFLGFFLCLLVRSVSCIVYLSIERVNFLSNELTKGCMVKH